MNEKLFDYVYKVFNEEIELISRDTPFSRHVPYDNAARLILLQRNTVLTWVKSMERGDLQVGDLEKMPFTLVFPTNISLAEHTKAIVGAAYAMAKAEEKAYKKKLKVRVNYDYLIAGALLHDVGKCVEITIEAGKSRSGKYLRHPIYGAIIAASCGIPEPVLHIIATHSREGDGSPRTKEAWLVHQADFAFFEPLKEPFEE